MDQLNANQNSEAFDLLNKAKALKCPLQNLEYTRAVCFLKLNQPYAAKEALREELRYFPNNDQASKLFTDLQKQISQRPSQKIDGQEFQTLAPIIHHYTMLSEPRLYSLFSLAKSVCLKDIPGNFLNAASQLGEHQDCYPLLLNDIQKDRVYFMHLTHLKACLNHLFMTHSLMENPLIQPDGQQAHVLPLNKVYWKFAKNLEQQIL
jgi:hypothetical protein